MTTTKPGSINVRISRKAYDAIMKDAIKNRRTFSVTVDILAGV